MEAIAIKILYGVILVIAFLLITMFGLGPVLFADGSFTERMVTLGVVILIYLALATLTYFVFRRKGK
ncbi:DUF6954 family protein [Paenibacillus glycanilyticus]